ncbi:MAG: phenylalanine--tRNA ligase subunit beta [Flavobacteriaceae bacterium]
MKISYNWLKQFIKTNKTPEEISTLLTDLGLEVEGIEKFESVKGGLKGVVVGVVLTCEKHPNADKLKVTTVDIGEEKPLQIVCGASNVAQGQKVPVATIGTTLYDKDGNSFQIKKGKIRGEDSFGMICAEDELGLGTSHDGIMILDDKVKIGTSVSQIFEIESDDVFEIGLTPNRADAMSHWGVARDIKAGLLQAENLHSEIITPSISNFRVDKRTLKIDVDVVDSKLCPRYCGVTISGITVKESPEWLKNRLKAIGLTPKNNVVDVTNYVLHELGQPLHAFDASKIKGNKIVVKTATEGTKFTTLDEVERTLSAEDLMIYNEEVPMALAGIMGGKNSAVTESTSNIFLESAYFDAVTVRKSAKRHTISSDASFRFERGIDPAITEYALKRAAILIKELAGGEITSDTTDLYPKKIEGHQVFLNFETLNKIIGQVIPQETIKNILTSLEIKIGTISDMGLGLTIPPYRVDVLREIDVIEDILRVYGYNNIDFSGKLNASVAYSSRTEEYRLQNIIAELLTANGFNEIMSNSLTTSQYVKLSEQLSEEQNVTILNPLSSDLSVMRQSLLFSGLEAISYNINRKNADLKFYEFGNTYKKQTNNYIENKHLSIFITGNRSAESWIEKSQKSDFFLLKSYIMLIINRLGIKGLRTSALSDDVFTEGIAIVNGSTVLAELGVLKKSILKHFDIKQEVLYADVKWENIIKLVTGKFKFTEIAKYPEVRRDLALLLDESVTFENIYQIAEQTDRKLIKEIDLFDVYQGDKLPQGKKSYAVSFILQDEEKTLTDEKIEKTMSKILSNLTEKLGVSLR